MDTFNVYFTLFCESILLFMFLYFLIQYIVLKKIEYLYYSAYLFLLAVYNLIALPEIFWSVDPKNAETILKFDLFKRPVQHLSSIFYSLFVIHYLNLSRQSFKLYKFLWVVIFIYCFGAITSFIFNFFRVEYEAAFYSFSFLFFPIQLYIVIILLKTQIRYARYVVWGSIILILGSIFTMFLSVINSSPEYHPWLSGMSPFVPVQLSILADLLLYTIALQRKVADNEKHLMKLAYARQHATLQERERIVADLHDDVGGGLSSIRMVSDLMLQESKKQNNETIINFAEKISASTKDIAQRMNTIIWSLNIKNDSIRNFSEYVRAYGLEYFDIVPITFKSTLPSLLPADIILSGEQRKNLFLILKEAFHNTLKHARAHTCTVEMKVEKEILIIEVFDDGLGIKSEAAATNQGKGNGLRNMQKRMSEINGNLDIRFLHEGTHLLIELPLKSE